jgi:hypothetical protein
MPDTFTIICTIWLDFICSYLLIGALFIFVPRVNNFLEDCTQKVQKEYPFYDEYLIRLVAYFVFILFWSYVWTKPFRSKK